MTYKAMDKSTGKSPYILKKFVGETPERQGLQSGTRRLEL